MPVSADSGVRRIDFAACSDVGLIRRRNEDVFAADAERGFMVLADGMGGHGGGDIAASITVHVVSEGLREVMAAVDHVDDLVGSALDIVDRANAAVIEMAGTDLQLAEMGSTLVFMAFHGDDAVCVNVGDSRAYRLRGEALECLSHDHTVLQQMVDHGMMTAQQAVRLGGKGCLTRAIGVEAAVMPELVVQEVFKGDIFLLCSDGLTDLVAEAEIAWALMQPLPLAGRAELLIDMSNQRGGFDNVSCVIAQPLYPDLT